jgi:hypothetical protein
MTVLRSTRTMWATVGTGDRCRLPGDESCPSELQVLCIGYGWCELTSRSVPQPAFRPIPIASRRRFHLPRQIRDHFGGLTDRPVMCLTAAWPNSVEVLLVGFDDAARTVVAASVGRPLLHWCADAPSAWRPDGRSLADPLERVDLSGHPDRWAGSAPMPASESVERGLSLVLAEFVARHAAFGTAGAQ